METAGTEFATFYTTSLLDDTANRWIEVVSPGSSYDDLVWGYLPIMAGHNAGFATKLAAYLALQSPSDDDLIALISASNAIFQEVFDAELILVKKAIAFSFLLESDQLLLANATFDRSSDCATMKSVNSLSQSGHAFMQSTNSARGAPFLHKIFCGN